MHHHGPRRSRGDDDTRWRTIPGTTRITGSSMVPLNRRWPAHRRENDPADRDTLQYVPRFSDHLISCSVSPAGISKSYYPLGEIERKIGIGDIVDPVKIPKMPKAEYDSLIKRQYVSRIAFGACDEHPYIAPFMYVFDGKLPLLPLHEVRQEDGVFQERSEGLGRDRGVCSRPLGLHVREPPGLPGGGDRSRAETERCGSGSSTMIRERSLSSRVLTAFGHTPRGRSRGDPPGGTVDGLETCGREGHRGAEERVRSFFGSLVRATFT